MASPNPDERTYAYDFEIAPGVTHTIYANSLVEAKKFFKEELPELNPENFPVSRKEPGFSRKGDPFANPN